MKKSMLKSLTGRHDFSEVDIAGLKSLFNEFYQDYRPGTPPEGFFYCDGYLNSESDANGKALYFEGHKISHLTCNKSGNLYYMVLGDADTKYIVCEFNTNNGQWYIIDETGIVSDGNVFKDPGQGWQPLTGESCFCRPGIQRGNCPLCEGTGKKIDFSAIRNKKS